MARLRPLAAAMLAVLLPAGCGGGGGMGPGPVRELRSLSPEPPRPRVVASITPNANAAGPPARRWEAGLPLNRPWEAGLPLNRPGESLNPRENRPWEAGMSLTRPRKLVVQKAPAVPKVVPAKVTRVLDRYLHGRGRATAMVRDLSTGRTYHYQRRLRLPTASTSKVDILMALLMKTSWRKLGDAARHDAKIMISHSDNKAADRLWLRIGGAYGLTRANRKLGLRHTTAINGRCVDLYCWGITRTSAEDQVKLLSHLVAKRSPVRKDDREQVRTLMQGVIKEQKWGVSAAACKGDEVALKNGWLRHVSNRRWAVVSAGLISGQGHDYAIAVLTEDSYSMGSGIAKVEGVAKRILAAFRGKQGCTDPADALATHDLTPRAPAPGAPAPPGPVPIAPALPAPSGAPAPDQGS